MRNKIINFFYKHRIIDSHVGIWDIHLWLYFLATYFDLYLVGIIVQIYNWEILNIFLQLNRGKRPRSLSFKFKIFGIGFDADREYNKELHKEMEKSLAMKKVALKIFKDGLNDEQRELIEKYDSLR